MSPRFFFNSNQDDAALYRPQIGFNRRTLLYTTTETKTVYTTTNCFAASFFQANAGVCANRRRDVEAQLRRMVAVKKDLETFQFDDGAPSPVET